MIIPVLIFVAIINVIFGFIILSRGFRIKTNILFSFIAMATALWSVAIVGFHSPDFRIYTDWTIFTHLFALLVSIIFFYFSAEFPRNLMEKKKWLYLASALPALAGYFLLLGRQVVRSDGLGSVAYSILPGYFPYALALMFYFGMGYIHLVIQYRKSESPREKLQIRDVLIGAILASTLAIIPDLVLPYFDVFSFTWLGPIFTLILVVSIFVGITRHNLFNIKVLLTELFVVLIILLLLVELIIATSSTALLITAAVLVLVVFFSFLLIKSVYREVDQREKIEKLAKELGETNDRQEKLIHFIGHEVKGYLTKGEYAFSEMVEGDYGELTPQVKVLATTALAETRKGVQAVTDILKAANLKRGTVTYDIQPADFRELVKMEVIKTKPMAEEKGLKFETDIDESGQCMVKVDKVHFSEHVLRNLIDNSIKYTPTGSITIGLSRQGDKVIFSVKDTGVGITDEDKVRLFTEGGRGKDSVKVNVHSTGYGLYIAKQIVEAHNGKILMESAGPGKGSTFKIELPAV